MSLARSALRRLAVSISVLVACTLAGGCFVPHAQIVRNAQDAFSDGATLENRQKYQASALDLSTLDGAEEHFATARGLAEQALTEFEGELRRDDLYGTTLTVHALSSWRLGDIDASLASAKKVTALAESESANTRVWPRDAALCRALPDLIKIDALGVTAGAFDQDTSAESFDHDLLKPAKAIRNSLHSTANVEAGHSLEVYFALSDLEIVFVVYRGLTQMHKSRRTQSAVADYLAMRSDALDRLGQLGSNPLHAGRAAALNTHVTYYTYLLLDEIAVTTPGEDGD